MKQIWKLCVAGIAAVALSISGVLLLRDRGVDATKVGLPVGLDEQAMKRLSRLGNGFIVWERHRNGIWEIWTKSLSGGQERLLVPRESGYDHFCPKLSPDGTLLAYLSYKRGTNAYEANRNVGGRLWIMNIAKAQRDLAAPLARSYGEDRSVTWLDNRRLCYIDGENRTQELELGKSGNRQVIRPSGEAAGYLPSPDLQYATSNTPEFGKLDKDGNVERRPALGGCQPYFTSDSRWGFWMRGAGGPLTAMRLPTREMKSVLEKDDPLMDGKHKNICFPMVSPCMRLLAFAASTEKHDHFAADYHVFVAPIHPTAMSVMGPPIRYTNGPECDRYPDVYRKELPLGSHFVEGETELTFTAPNRSKTAHWRFDDHTRAVGRTVKHTFRSARGYWIECSSSVKGKDVRYRGFVSVAPARPPLVRRLRRAGHRSVEIMFNEDIDASKAVIKGGPDQVVTDIRTTHDGTTLTVTFAAELSPDAFITLDGVRDKSQASKIMPRTVLGVPRREWPPSERGLVAAWRDAIDKDPVDEGVSTHPEPQRKAFWDEHGSMKLQRGWFDLTGAGRRMGDACRSSNAFTLEFIATPQANERNDPTGTLLTLSGKGVDFLQLSQRNEHLFAKLLTSAGPTPWHRLGVTSMGMSNHVVVALAGGVLQASVDGVDSPMALKVEGDLRQWQPDRLRFGSSSDGSHPWRGLIDRVLVYGAPLTQGEARQHSESAETEIQRRFTTDEWWVKVRLVEASPVPTLKDIQPYREGLVRHLYEQVIDAGALSAPARRFIVTHWAWLGGEAMPAQKIKVGDIVSLRVQLLDAHKELQYLPVKDAVSARFNAEQVYDAGDWDVP